PDKIAFQNVPTKVFKGTKMPVKAVVTDPESPVMKGQMFFGALQEGKLPKDAKPIEARRLSKDEDIWTAELPLPDVKTPAALDLTAQFTNAAGLTATQSIKVEVVDPPPPSGTVAGKVVEGDRPQAKQDVKLADDKEVKATAKTNDKGEFLFENVKPGPYKVLCQK